MSESNENVVVENSAHDGIEHEEIAAISVTCQYVFRELDHRKTGQTDKVHGDKSTTTCNWTVIGDIYEDKTEYLVTIKTDAKKRLSLYTLGIQCRCPANSIAVLPVINDSVVFEEQVNCGTREIRPNNSGDCEGWYSIPGCRTESTDGAEEPAREEDVCFITLKGKGERECMLRVRSNRINHRAFGKGGSGVVHSHDNLPPQPASGANN